LSSAEAQRVFLNEKRMGVYDDEEEEEFE